jgi:hypothetical protein
MVTRDQLRLIKQRVDHVIVQAKQQAVEQDEGTWQRFPMPHVAFLDPESEDRLTLADLKVPFACRNVRLNRSVSLGPDLN